MATGLISLTEKKPKSLTAEFDASLAAGTAKPAAQRTQEDYNKLYKAAVDSYQSGFSNEDIITGAERLGFNRGDMIEAYRTNRPDMFATQQEIEANVNKGPEGIAANEADPRYQNIRTLDNYLRGGGLVSTATPTPISAPKPVVPDDPYGGMTQQYAPSLNRQVDAPTETIEGRIGNILKRDAQGNYTNEAVRQAVERAQQQFAKRGLVNTSMAAQAGQEAAIAKAIEIAGPDAERYFQQGRANQDATNVFARDETQQGYTERNNLNQWQQDRSMQDDRITADDDLQRKRMDQDWYLQELDRNFRAGQLSKEQAFNLRQNYVTAQDRVSQSYQRMVDTINTSQMEPEEKTAAIANAARIRDSESAYINSIFAKQPEWQSDWLALSVQVGAASIESMSDINTLATIANDPAQPADVRAKARARLDQLLAQSPEPTPAPTQPPDVDYGAA